MRATAPGRPPMPRSCILGCDPGRPLGFVDTETATSFSATKIGQVCLRGGQAAVTRLPLQSAIKSTAFISDTSVLSRFMAASTVVIRAGSRVHEVQFRGDDAKHARQVIPYNNANG